MQGEHGDHSHGMTPHSSVQNRSRRPRRTLIISYRAADCFPVHIDNRTDSVEAFTRLVKGRPADEARFTLKRFPIPIYSVKERLALRDPGDVARQPARGLLNSLSGMPRPAITADFAAQVAFDQRTGRSLQRHVVYGAAGSRLPLVRRSPTADAGIDLGDVPGVSVSRLAVTACEGGLGGTLGHEGGTMLDGIRLYAC